MSMLSPLQQKILADHSPDIIGKRSDNADYMDKYFKNTYKACHL